MTRRSQQLVRELLNLCTKYSSADFQQAIRQIESGEATHLLVRLSRGMASASNRDATQRAKQASPSRKRSPKEQLDAYTRDLREKGDETSLLLAEFLTAISERVVLKNAATLRHYAAHLGLSSGTKLDRSLIARQIGDKLRELPASIPKEIALASELSGSTSSLQAWSDLIVKDRG